MYIIVLSHEISRTFPTDFLLHTVFPDVHTMWIDGLTMIIYKMSDSCNCFVIDSLFQVPSGI